MSVEDVRKTAHIRDLIVSRLEPAVREAYQRASQKAWRAAGRGDEISYSVDEVHAVELVEQKFLDAIRHRRNKSVREMSRRWVSR